MLLRGFVGPGIEEEVDLNVFNGTMEELLELTLKTPCIER